jgi:negative regulator of flagellin synthesis FlgM
MNIKGIGNLPINDLKAQQSSNKAGKAPVNDDVPKPAAASGATVELSSKAKGLKEIERSLADLPDVDENRVSELKKRVESGEYQIDSQKVAGKLLDIEDML